MESILKVTAVQTFENKYTILKKYILGVLGSSPQICLAFSHFEAFDQGVLCIYNVLLIFTSSNFSSLENSFFLPIPTPVFYWFSTTFTYNATLKIC